jgi:hypothetical protein
MAYIAFNKPFDKTGLVSITLMTEHKVLNIIDSGSNLSHIDKTVLEQLTKYKTLTSDQVSTSGICGEIPSNGKVEVSLRNDIFNFTLPLVVSDISHLSKAVARSWWTSRSTGSWH